MVSSSRDGAIILRQRGKIPHTNEVYAISISTASMDSPSDEGAIILGSGLGGRESPSKRIIADIY